MGLYLIMNQLKVLESLLITRNFKMKKKSVKALYTALFFMALISVASFNTYAQDDFSTSDDIIEEESSEQESVTIDDEGSSESVDDSDSY